ARRRHIQRDNGSTYLAFDPRGPDHQQRGPRSRSGSPAGDPAPMRSGVFLHGSRRTVRPNGRAAWNAGNQLSENNQILRRLIYNNSVIFWSALVTLLSPLTRTGVIHTSISKQPTCLAGGLRTSSEGIYGRSSRKVWGSLSSLLTRRLWPSRSRF